jgi:hypothetical protein
MNLGELIQITELPKHKVSENSIFLSILSLQIFGGLLAFKKSKKIKNRKIKIKLKT